MRVLIHAEAVGGNASARFAKLVGIEGGCVNAFVGAAYRAMSGSYARPPAVGLAKPDNMESGRASGCPADQGRAKETASGPADEAHEGALTSQRTSVRVAAARDQRVPSRLSIPGPARPRAASLLRHHNGPHVTPVRLKVSSAMSDDGETPQRQLPNIVLTGTPGTGKTTHAQLLANATPVPLKHINVGEWVKEKGLHEGFDEEWQSYIVDEDKVRIMRFSRRL